MSYYFSTTLRGISFDDAITKVTEQLKTEGFGVLTDIDIQGTLKKKIGAELNKYRILGACNPPAAHKAIQAEHKIGVFLPCNVIVTENEAGEVEVTAVDPVASMMSVQNDSLGDVATDIQNRLKKVIDSL
ncbi:MAG TPA: hypothetical protein DEQ34_06940 [Balneolaceae bacterium]|nr:hypothetical protein [Balneolaceae bacterium]|tara:strand:- start:69285 stop:69674 length:390 start_codon:yes stop_codon:yes gene_type:complete